MHRHFLRQSLRRFCSSETGLQQIKVLPYTSANELASLLSQPNPLKDTVTQILKGQLYMPISQYWSLALTDQQGGYYTTRQAFAKDGDFITSPQISPLFSEMVAVWIQSFLLYIKHPEDQRVRIVELGGGRGKLMAGIISSLHDLGRKKGIDIAMIEVSDLNRKTQQQAVLDTYRRLDKFFAFQFENKNQKQQLFLSEDTMSNDARLLWVPTLEELLKDDQDREKLGQKTPLTIIVSNQFFDALPVRVFKRKENEWREKVLTLDPTDKIGLTLSPHPVPDILRPNIPNPEQGVEIEISPQGLITMDLMAKMISRTGGAILSFDYGGEGYFSDSIRAIREHKYVPSPVYWSLPGKCDLSAYVDFSSLANFASKNVGITSFPILPQGYFLEAMGINVRIDALSEKAKPDTKASLQGQYERLVLPDEMGLNYKAQLITLSCYGDIYPFERPTE